MVAWHMEAFINPCALTKKVYTKAIQLVLLWALWTTIKCNPQFSNFYFLQEGSNNFPSICMVTN